MRPRPTVEAARARLRRAFARCGALERAECRDPRELERAWRSVDEARAALEAATMRRRARLLDAVARRVA